MNQITVKNFGNGGRLGNHLFTIAACIGLANKYGFKASFPRWGYNQYFENELPIDNVVPTHIYTEPYFHYTDPLGFGDAVQIKDSPDKIIELRGYWQSEKYFDRCTRIIKEQFTPNESVILKLVEKYGDSFHGETCSIHIRRGDYVNNGYYADIEALGYYARAISYLKSKKDITNFFIFSDDIEWCKANFGGDNFKYIEGNSDIEDLFLMASCAHNIGANSSFSYWGNYLNPYDGKISVFPKEWFGADGSHLDTKDLYLKKWITL